MYKEPKSRSKSFGLAKDYYRARMLRVNEELPVDLDWKDGIIYSSPKPYPSKLKVTYRLQILTPDNQVGEIAIVRDKNEARKRLKKMEEDLNELTKMKFDEKYKIDVDAALTLPQGDNADDSVMFFAGVERRNGEQP